MYISEAFGYEGSENLEKYLGIPLQHERVNKVTLQGVLDKVNERLSPLAIGSCVMI
uniref:Uncharacterized protein n=1 Tax=Cajanus cajan TaxID=3821 RepID=A0A151RPC6_CAJCA|nr:hypothetical protein KK1_034146 [Cajanus cajan]